MPDFTKLLYLPLDIPPMTDVDMSYLYTLDLDEVTKLGGKDLYRECWIVSLKSLHNEWRDMVNNFPGMRDYLEREIIPYFGDSRITIIVTPPNGKHNMHIDCSPNQFWDTEKLPHKYRQVIQGNVSDLEFLNTNGSVFPEEANSSFMMNGKWPHTMHNTYAGSKYTLAVGIPWYADLQNDKKYVELLERSYEKYKQYYLEYDESKLIPNYQDLFEGTKKK